MEEFKHERDMLIKAHDKLTDPIWRRYFKSGEFDHSRYEEFLKEVKPFSDEMYKEIAKLKIKYGVH